MSADDGGIDETTGYVGAVADLRAAEAARVLGLLDVTTLAGRARWWIDSGIDTPAARALAAAAAGPPVPPTVLLATLAAEHGVAVHDIATARAIHAEMIIGLAGQGGDFSRALFGLSNSVTDGFTSGVRRWWGRHRRR